MNLQMHLDLITYTPHAVFVPNQTTVSQKWHHLHKLINCRRATCWPQVCRHIWFHILIHADNMLIFWITYRVSIELPSSSLYSSYSVFSNILPPSSSPSFSAPPRVSVSLLYLPSPAFFIPPSVPLPLHHCCLLQQKQQQQWRSHQGHLSDSAIISLLSVNPPVGWLESFHCVFCK